MQPLAVMPSNSVYLRPITLALIDKFSILDSTQTLWHGRTLMRVTRQLTTALNEFSNGNTSDLILTYVASSSFEIPGTKILISLPASRLYTRHHETFYELLREAKEQYEEELETRVVVYVVDLVSTAFPPPGNYRPTDACGLGV